MLDELVHSVFDGYMTAILGLSFDIIIEQCN